MTRLTYHDYDEAVGDALTAELRREQCRHGEVSTVILLAMTACSLRGTLHKANDGLMVRAAAQIGRGLQ